MTSDRDVESLRAEHQELERQIAEENQHPNPNEFRIKELKRQKLLVKDRIAGHGRDTSV